MFAGLFFSIFMALSGCASKKTPMPAVLVPIPTESEKESLPFEEPPKEKVDQIKSLEIALQTFSKFSYTQDDEKNAHLILLDKKEELDSITLPCVDLVLEQKNYHEVTAGIYIGAAAELRYAEMILRYPVPSGLTHLAKVVFQERLIELVRQLRDGARGKLEILINNDLRSGKRGEYPEMAIKLLQELYPLDYQLIPVQKGTQVDALHAFLQYEDRSLYQPRVIWPQSSSGIKKIKKRLTEAEKHLSNWGADCEVLLNELEILHPSAKYFCLGRNANTALRAIVEYPSSLDSRMRSAEKFYRNAVARSSGILSSENGGSSTVFWAEILEKESLSLRRDITLSERLKTGHVEINPQDLDKVWHYRQPSQAELPELELHLMIHAHRIHFNVERLMRSMRRLSRNKIALSKSLKHELPDKIEAISKEAAEVLALYHENTTHRDRILMAIGLVHAAFAEKVLDNMRHFVGDEYDHMFRLAGKNQLQGLRLLRLSAERAGDRSRWSERSGVELNFYRPPED